MVRLTAGKRTAARGSGLGGFDAQRLIVVVQHVGIGLRSAAQDGITLRFVDGRLVERCCGVKGDSKSKRKERSGHGGLLWIQDTVSG